jgi:hypothetical protein
MSAKLICGKKQTTNVKEVNDFQAACMSYVKCDHKKCNDSELKLRSEIVKVPIEKTIKIMKKCITKMGDNKRQCGLNEQKKLSPKIKKLVEDVENCRDELCKDESDTMLKTVNDLLNSKHMKKPLKNIMKGIKAIRKNKTQKEMKNKVESIKSSKSSTRTKRS